MNTTNKEVNSQTNMQTTQPQGELSLQTICMPADTNYMGDIFGGWLLGQMDIAGAIFAGRKTKGRVVTIAIKDMAFLVPVHVGDVISCYTSIERIGKTSLTALVEAWVLKNDSDEPVKVTAGSFTFVAMDDMGNKREISV